uniref:LCCL domain-containing protein n=1 Tax=Macrostomum lignano TaxID=282301 RepID=A0A1I8FRX8_9PLAT
PEQRDVSPAAAVSYFCFVLAAPSRSIAQPAVDRYGCTHRTGRPAIVSINSSAYNGTTRFSVELNLVNISYCHAEFHGVGDVLLPSCWTLNWSRLAPVRLAALYRDGLCYGAAHPNNSRATFTNAAVGCRYVRANLALGFVSSTADVLGLASTTTWPTVKIPGLVWPTPPKAFFLDSDSFYYGSSSSITFKGSSTYTCFGGNCRCVYFSAGSFYIGIIALRCCATCAAAGPAGCEILQFEHAGQKPGNRRCQLHPFNWDRLCIRYLWYRRAVANSRSGAPVAANYAMTADAPLSRVAPAPANSHCTAPPAAIRPSQPDPTASAAYSPGIGANEPGAVSMRAETARLQQDAFGSTASLRQSFRIWSVVECSSIFGWLSAGLD